MGMSMRDFAESRGVDKETIRQAILAGRMSASVKRKGNRYDIDPELADQELAQNTDPNKRNNVRGKTPTAKPANYTQARAVKEMYAARLMQLDFEERAGTLVKAEEVKLAAFKSARLTRDAMLNIPARVVNEVVALIGNLSPEKRHEILLILQREIHSALTQEADSDGPQ